MASIEYSNILNQIKSVARQLQTHFTLSKEQNKNFNFREKRKIRKFSGKCRRIAEAKDVRALYETALEVMELYPEVKEILFDKRWLLGFDKRGDAERIENDFFNRLDRLKSNLTDALSDINRARNVQNRREFLRKLAVGAAAIAVQGHLPKRSHAQPARNPNDFSDNEKLDAINKALDWLEDYFEKRSRNLQSTVQFAPHADYTHFNRVGQWSHKQILESAHEDENFIEYGGGLFERQREEARAVHQPIDLDVSITERSIVTLANMTGRCRNKKLLYVPKHFPGGPPETELTEVQGYVDMTPVEQFTGLIPFSHLAKTKLMETVMVGHASYPNLEEHYAKKYFEKYELPIINELRQYGLSESEYIRLTRVRPATLSPILIRGVLGDELGYTGHVMPDVLNMGAVREYMDRFSHIEEANRMPKHTLLVIFAIYAGICHLLGLPEPLNFPEPRDAISKFIDKHMNNSSYFKKCYDDAYKKSVYVNIKYCNKDENYINKIKLDKIERLYVLGLSTDPWDRSGKIHQLFRMAYFNALYGTSSFFEEKNLSIFGQYQANTDWKSLDPLFELLIEKRYTA